MTACKRKATVFHVCPECAAVVSYAKVPFGEDREVPSPEGACGDCREQEMAFELWAFRLTLGLSAVCALAAALHRLGVW